jgi:hypothetical protein
MLSWIPDGASSDQRRTAGRIALPPRRTSRSSTAAPGQCPAQLSQTRPDSGLVCDGTQCESCHGNSWRDLSWPGCQWIGPSNTRKRMSRAAARRPRARGSFSQKEPKSAAPCVTRIRCLTDRAQREHSPATMVNAGVGVCRKPLVSAIRLPGPLDVLERTPLRLRDLFPD